MATSPASSTPVPGDGEALPINGEEQEVMTEFVIAITAFCALIFIFCVAFVFLFAYCKRIHREEDEGEGEYIGDEESLSSTQQSQPSHTRKSPRGHPQSHPQGHIQGHHPTHSQGHPQSHGPGHRSHLLSVWDTYPLYYVREMSVAKKFWEEESAVRNPMHRSPTVIY